MIAIGYLIVNTVSGSHDDSEVHELSPGLFRFTVDQIKHSVLFPKLDVAIHHGTPDVNIVQ